MQKYVISNQNDIKFKSLMRGEVSAANYLNHTHEVDDYKFRGTESRFEANAKSVRK